VHPAGMVINPSCRIPLGIRAIPRAMTNLFAIEAWTVIRGSLRNSLTRSTPRKSDCEGLVNSRLHI